MKLNRHTILSGCYSIFLILIFLSCENNADSGSSQELGLKAKQYLIEGKRLYKLHCANCHMDDGQGLARLIPPLSQSDFMLSDINRTICIIKNGMAGEINVNGIFYNHPMPGLTHLTDIEIAEISTYLYNSWGHNEGIVTIQQVQEALRKCSAGMKAQD